MDVIPVLDLLGGQVVRGVAGQRESYAPIESTLVDSAKPLDIARSIRDTFGLHRLYVADLDAIMQDAPQWSVIDELVIEGFDLLVDAGLREPERATQLVERGVRQVIAALETLPDSGVLNEIVNSVGPERVVFSLDLKQGRALGDLSGWGETTPQSIVDTALTTNISTVIVLDLSGVGVGQGLPTLSLCRQIIASHPEIRVITGGGVRDLDDIQQAAALGIDGLLVASALHNGSISRDELAAITS